MEGTLNALLSLIPLESLPRTGWVQKGIASPETLAGHVLSVAHLALALAPKVQPALDVDRVLALCVVHDSPEALTGDLPRSGSVLLPEGAKRTAERAAAKILLAPLSALAFERSEEFMNRETREARFAAVCDRLQLGLRLLAYLESGQRGLEDFVKTVQEADLQEFPPALEFQATLLKRIAAIA
jgi:putative hydrolase of HD superfamily